MPAWYDRFYTNTVSLASGTWYIAIQVFQDTFISPEQIELINEDLAIITSTSGTSPYKPLLPTQMYVSILDEADKVYNLLETVEVSNIRARIIRNSLEEYTLTPLLEKIEWKRTPYNKKLKIVLYDRYDGLRNKNIDLALYDYLTISDLASLILSELPYNLNISFIFDWRHRAAQGGELPALIRVPVDNLTELSGGTVSYYDALIALCERFGLQLFQEKNYYVFRQFDALNTASEYRYSADGLFEGTYSVTSSPISGIISGKSTHNSPVKYAILEHPVQEQTDGGLQNTALSGPEKWTLSGSPLSTPDGYKLLQSGDTLYQRTQRVFMGLNEISVNIKMHYEQDDGSPSSTQPIARIRLKSAIDSTDYYYNNGALTTIAQDYEVYLANNLTHLDDSFIIQLPSGFIGFFEIALKIEPGPNWQYDFFEFTHCSATANYTDTGKKKFYVTSAFNKVSPTERKLHIYDQNEYGVYNCMQFWNGRDWNNTFDWSSGSNLTAARRLANNMTGAAGHRIIQQKNLIKYPINPRLSNIITSYGYDSNEYAITHRVWDIINNTFKLELLELKRKTPPIQDAWAE